MSRNSIDKNELQIGLSHAIPAFQSSPFVGKLTCFNCDFHTAEANKKAREERERERVRLAKVITIQSLIRQHRTITRLASDIRAHWVVDNPHDDLGSSKNRIEWLLRAFREFLFVQGHLPFVDARMVSLLLPYLSSEYFSALIIPEYRFQWIEQAYKLSKLAMTRFSQCSELLHFLPAFTDYNTFTSISGSSIPSNIVSETINTIHQKLKPVAINLLATHFSGPSSWESPQHKALLLQSIIQIIDNDDITPTLAQLIIELGCSDIPIDQFDNVSLARKLLALLSASQNILNGVISNPIAPIIRSNFVKVAQFIKTKMKLFSVAGADSLESFASEIALELEKLNEFERAYKKELEDEEDFLDANDVHDIEKRYRSVRESSAELQEVTSSVSQVATAIFSEGKLFSLVKRLSDVSDLSVRLESFGSVAVLISRLKNTIGISTGAFLALSLPLLPVWPAIYQKYQSFAVKPALTSSTQSASLSAAKALDDVAPLFSLYCQSYAFYLSTRITDKDFYVKQTYVTLEQNKQIVNLFKRCVQNRSKLFSSGIQLPAPTIAFFKNFNLLLIQLQSRNHSQTWAQTNELLLPELRAEGLQLPHHPTHLIAKYCPMLIPMLEKVKLFNALIAADREENQPEDAWTGTNSIMINIRRGSMLLTDAFQKLMPLHSRLKEKLRVQFFSEDGTPEPGIDGGGLFRELFTEVVKLTFSPDFGLFSTTEFHELYPNPHSDLLVEESLRKYQFLGQLLGKCIYESLLVDLPFAHFFLTLLQGQVNSVRDLASYDPELFSNLQSLLDMPAPEDMGLTFEFGEKQFDGSSTMVDLIENGSNLPVTSQNVGAYVQLIADRRLNRLIAQQAQAFRRGLADVIDLDWIRLFTPAELSLAICGGGRLDVTDLRENVQFAGGFHDQHPTVLLLWEVLEEMSSEEQQAFLRFVTSVSRPPLLGFATLNPQLCIRLNKADVSHLPSANTCINLLKMPPYPTKKLLHEKLLYAINSGARFELS